MSTDTKKFTLLLAGWLILGLLLIVLVVPYAPKPLRNPIAFLLTAPPLYLLGEGLFGWLFSPEHGKAISTRQFSTARVVIALLVMSLFVALIFIVGALG